MMTENKFSVVRNGHVEQIKNDITPLYRYYSESADVFDVNELTRNKGLSVQNGFSLWSSPAIMFQTLQNDEAIKCQQVISIPESFVLLFDQCYVANDLNNVKHEFRHYLISVNDDVQELKNKYDQIGTQSCVFPAESGTLEEFYDLFDDSHMEGYAMQHVLRRNANNTKVSMTSRVTSAILSVWIGSNQLDESSLFMMYHEFPWAFHFIHRCFQTYPCYEASWSDYYSQCVTTMKHIMFPLSTISSMCIHVAEWENRCCLKYKREVPEVVYHRDLIEIIGTSSEFRLEQIQGNMNYFFSFSGQVTMGFQSSNEGVSVGFSNRDQTRVLSCKECLDMNSVIHRFQEFIETHTVFLDSEEIKEFCVVQMKHLLVFSNIVWNYITTVYLYIYDNGMCQIATK